MWVVIAHYTNGIGNVYAQQYAYNSKAQADATYERLRDSTNVVNVFQPEFIPEQGKLEGVRPS